jgi:O-acetylserine/cysteine efflux transporter
MTPYLRTPDLLAALMVAVIWGVNFVAAKFGLHYFAPLFLMGLRFLLVAVVLLPITGKPTIPLDKAFWIAVTYGVGYHALLFTGVWHGLDVATSIITVQLNVPFTSLLGVWFLGDKLGWRRIVGMVVAFSGILIITGSPTVLHEPYAFSLVLLAAGCWALFNIQMKQLGSVQIFSFLAWVSVFTAPLLFLLSWLLEPPQLPLLSATPLSAVGSIAYMAILSTIVGFGSWFRLLSHYSVHQIAPFSMLMPVFGIVAAILTLGEPLTWQIFIGGIITLVGVTVIVLRRPKNVIEGAIAN